MANRWTRFLGERFYLSCQYDMNKSRFIGTLMDWDYSDYRIFELGYLNNLVVNVEYFTDRRARLGFTPIIYVYPTRNDWVGALEEEFIPESEFTKHRRIDFCRFSGFERFRRLFTEWENVITEWDRYVMSHKACHGARYKSV